MAYGLRRAQGSWGSLGLKSVWARFEPELSVFFGASCSQGLAREGSEGFEAWDPGLKPGCPASNLWSLSGVLGLVEYWVLLLF